MFMVMLVHSEQRWLKAGKQTVPGKEFERCSCRLPPGMTKILSEAQQRVSHSILSAAHQKDALQCNLKLQVWVSLHGFSDFGGF